MSEVTKPSLFQRLFGVGDQPKGEPAKKAPPSDVPERIPSQAPVKKEPPAERPAKKEPPQRKGPAIGAKPPTAEPKDKSKAALEPGRSWFDQLRHGLARTSNALSDNLAGALTKRKLDEDTLDRIEEVLIKADLGVAMAGRIRAAIAKGRYERGLDPDAVREVVGVRDRQRARAGGERFCSRSRNPPACVPGGRGERHRQDHDHRQDGASVQAQGLERHARRRRYVPRRGHRSAQSVGRARWRGGGRQRGRRRPGRRRLRRARTRPRAKASTCC